MPNHPSHADKSQVRSFGLTVGAVFSVISVWPFVFRGESIRVWAALPAAILLIPALVYPNWLQPLYRWWMRLSAVLGWINTRIILGIGFYLVFAPIGVVLRIMGKDPLRRVFVQESTTYRVSRSPRAGNHMRHQF
jgi:hypothetical protein